MNIHGPGTCAERWIGIFKDEVLDEQDLISSKGIVAINAAIDHLLEIATDVGMGTTRGVFCPQDRAFLHANVAIPAWMMRELGSASCGDRRGQSGWNSVVRGSL